MPAAFLATTIERFGLGRVLLAPKRVSGGGHRDEVWRVRTVRGDWAVKARPARHAECMEARIGVERELLDGGIPLPVPRTTRDGRGTLVVGKRAVNVRSWVDAPGASWVPDERDDEHALLLARALSRLHTGSWSATAPARHVLVREPAASWSRMALDAHAIGRTWADALERAVEPLTWAEGVIADGPTTTGLRLCHLDANPHNVLVHGDGASGNGITIIDWDGAGLACPSGEIAGVVAAWACQGDGSAYEDLPERMVAAYRDEGAIFEPTGIGVFAQHLTGWCNWIEAIVLDGLARPDHDERTVIDALRWTRRLPGLPDLVDRLH